MAIFGPPDELVWVVVLRTNYGALYAPRGRKILPLPNRAEGPIRALSGSSCVVVSIVVQSFALVEKEKHIISMGGETSSRRRTRA